MHRSTIRTSVLLAIVVAGALLSGGCFTLAPSSVPMTFIRTHPAYSQFYNNLYSPVVMNKQDHVNVVFRAPANTVIKFEAGKRVVIQDTDTQVIPLRDGMYPFALQKADSRKHLLSGAIMVRNMNKEVALATLGKTEETKMFSDTLVKTALKGQLASYTVSFDGRDVITYWLGNRKTPYTGGEPTVELDFTRTPDISMLKIAGRTRGNKRAVVNVYGAMQYDPQRRIMARKRAEHAIQFTSNGTTFRGYIRNLKDNEFTAFVRIPCTIPKSLMDAAAGGTVSKFTVKSTGDRPESVAEVVISSM